MTTLVDAILLLLIFFSYGIGDVATTLYGMRNYGLKEANPVMTRLFGETFHWSESVAAKVVTLVGVVFIYAASRVWNSSKVYQILWWCIAVAIIAQGVRVSFLNWRDIRASQ